MSADKCFETFEQSAFVLSHEFVLPDANDLPSQLSQSPADLVIPRHVGPDLFPPEGGVGLGPGSRASGTLPRRSPVPMGRRRAMPDLSAIAFCDGAHSDQHCGAILPEILLWMSRDWPSSWQKSLENLISSLLGCGGCPYCLNIGSPHMRHFRAAIPGYRRPLTAWLVIPYFLRRMKMMRW